MILTICAIILLIVGILYLVLPGKYLVNEKNIKPGETFEQTVKRQRKLAVVFIALGLLFLII